MSQSIQYRCDVCGAVKQESNHWWMMRAFFGLLQVCTWEIGMEWEKVPENPALHICGQACAIRKLNKFMGAPGDPDSVAGNSRADRESEPSSAVEANIKNELLAKDATRDPITEVRGSDPARAEAGIA